jgi:hypothetical protein
MPKYKVTTEKGTYLIETADPSTPDKGTVTPQQAQQAFAAMKTPDDRSGLQVAGDQAMNVLEGIGQGVVGIPGMVKDVASAGIDMMRPGGMQRNVDRGMSLIQGGLDTAAPLVNDTRNLAKILMDQRSNIPQSTPEQQQGYANAAGQNAAPLIMGEGIKNSFGMENPLPSKERAGANFQTVMGAARNEPLNLQMADDAALRAQELAGRGGIPGRGSSLPKVMRDYLRTREQNPTMTYEVGRDFQSAAGRLSTAEAQAANPVMKAQVSKLAKALADSNRDAAVRAGVGAEYDSAMNEYRQASQLADMKDSLIDVLKRHGAKAALGAGLGYGIYEATRK